MGCILFTNISSSPSQQGIDSTETKEIVKIVTMQRKIKQKEYVMAAVSLSRSREATSLSSRTSSGRSDESAPEWTLGISKKLLSEWTSNESETLEKIIAQSDNSVKPEQLERLDSYSGILPTYE